MFNIGCYWHACTKCYKIQSIEADEKIRIGMRRDADNLRFERIVDAGYELIKIRECEFDAELKNNSEMREYFQTLEHLELNKLDIRDAYFGGRTNATKLYYKCENGEKIRYIDVCSLYPYVLKYFSMPIGVPRVLINNDLIGRSAENIEGIIRCKILPPKSLYHPVLPVKMHNKLLFILCYNCALQKNNRSCECEDDQRSFIGTYVADELRLAIRFGYRVLKIYEAWEYDIIKYDKIKNEPGLFSEYIDFFLKMKTEASGYPNWVKSEHDKDLYIENYYKNENIILDKNKIENNPGFRTLAKALLNYLYGKFGERGNKLKKAIVTSRDKLVKLVSNESLEIHSMVEMSDSAVMFTYRLIEECQQDAQYVNVAIAAYTTAHARTVLYNYLHTLNESVLYFDTDSVIYVERKETPKILTGDFLGDMTNELGPNEYIDCFVSGGPKNYAFQIKVEGSDEVKTVCKVKGIRLNYMNSKQVNFDSMRNLLFSKTECEHEEEQKIHLKNKMILREVNNIVYTKEVKYDYKINVTKRRRTTTCSFDTLPFGHA